MEVILLSGPVGQNQLFHSLNADTLNGSPVWEVKCHRVTMGKTPDKHVILDYNTLSFVSYAEDK